MNLSGYTNYSQEVAASFFQIEELLRVVEFEL
jgi:hypothetical protein